MPVSQELIFVAVEKREVGRASDFADHILSLQRVSFIISFNDVNSVLFCLHCFIFFASTDGPECSREYEGQDAELRQAVRSHRGSGCFLG